MKIIDAHTHIDYISCDDQLDVVGAVCCAVMESDWKRIVDICNKDKRVYGAFGIHPWFIDVAEKDFDKRLEILLKTDSNYMVGEIGLDKHKPDMEHQMDVFTKQFDIAVRLKRIVCLHCVGAWDKILHIFKQYKQSELPMIIVHGFNENEDILKQLLKYEKIYFSIDKNVVHGRICRIDKIPLNHILVESDAKSDVLLRNIVEKISDIKNDKNMPNIIYNNALKVLNNGQIK